MKRQRYVITGPPGSGKTSLIEELRAAGYWCAPEAAREVRATGHTKSATERNRAIIEKNVEWYKAAPRGTLCFYDRGLPDTLAYAAHEGDPAIDEYRVTIDEYPYDNPVFILPSWHEIYQTDSERGETWAEATAIERYLYDTYWSLGYTVLTVPRASTAERLAFIEDFVAR